MLGLYSSYMTSILVSLDEATHRALNRVAPAAKRQRSEFIRRAIQRAVQQAEFARMRKAYLEQPDAHPESDDWSTWEEFRP